MRLWEISIGVTLIWFLPELAKGQPYTPGATSPQIRKTWVLGERVARSLEGRDGRIDDPGILAYLWQIENRVAVASRKRPVDIRLTRSSDPYAALLPNKVLYISGGMLEYVQNEAELAGLMAHQLPHADELVSSGPPQPAATVPMVHFGECVVAASLEPVTWVEGMREKEWRANAEAMGYLKVAGYDPSGVLDLFSKLAYDHPIWARAIVPEDLLRLRAEIDADPTPPTGYIVNSSRVFPDAGETREPAWPRGKGVPTDTGTTLTRSASLLWWTAWVEGN